MNLKSSSMMEIIYIFILHSVENRNILDNRVDMYLDTFSYETRTIARSLQIKADDFVGYSHESDNLCLNCYIPSRVAAL